VEKSPSTAEPGRRAAVFLLSAHQTLDALAGRSNNAASSIGFTYLIGFEAFAVVLERGIYGARTGELLSRNRLKRPQSSPKFSRRFCR
jgi:hypothetical protein